MKSLFSHRSTRRTAAVMLFVWLLALATGMANACLLQQAPARHGHTMAGLAATRTGAMEAAGGLPASAQARADDHEAASHATAACQNFCAAESSGLLNPQGAKTTLLADAPVLLARGVGLLVPTAEHAARRPNPSAPPGSAPPVAIRFLRLTI